MISVTDVELRAGARLLIDGVSFQVAAGDKIGLVGRNGAGKTTLARVLAGEGIPAAGAPSLASTRASVVLPAPFRPTRPILSPGATWKDTESSSRRAPARSSSS